jgi:photosystem II stability/assembly factor-like uncharacterized protein
LPIKGYIGAIAIDAQSPSTIYVLADGKIFKSTDAATTWNLVAGDLPGTWIYTLSIDPQNSTTLYAGTYSGLFRSTDAAGSWSAVTINAEFPALRPPSWYVVPYERNSNILFAIATSCYGFCGTRLFKSVDGGDTWNEPVVSFNDYPFGRADILRRLVIDPRNPDTVYAVVDHNNDYIELFGSTDGGVTWKILKGFVSDVAIDPRDPNALYAATEVYFGPNGVITSTDGGTNWEPLKEGFPRSAFFRILVIDPQDTIYAGTTAGLFALRRGAGQR